MPVLFDQNHRATLAGEQGGRGGAAGAPANHQDVGGDHAVQAGVECG